ncbi:MAG TPA: WbqC family protein [Candidatus Deferrimicrobium sp.]|nr:WbqC family protein [Candidatus Deferrimicrobium sp.]
MNKKIVAIHQPNFMPWLGFFYKWSKADLMVFLDDVAFTKGSYINRTRIRDAANEQWLTIPVHQKGRLNQPIAETGIKNDLPWRDSVLGKLRSCYGKARYFKNYFLGFEAVIMKEHLLLAGLNIELLQWLAGLLEIKTPWVLSSSLEGVSGKATDRLVSICRQLGASAYLSGFGGQKYQEEEEFKKHHIELAVYDFQHPVYPQRGEEFIPGLSIIDLLFNCGTESGGLLKIKKIES